MPLGTEVGFGPGHIMLDGDPAVPKLSATASCFGIGCAFSEPEASMCTSTSYQLLDAGFYTRVVCANTGCWNSLAPSQVTFWTAGWRVCQINPGHLEIDCDWESKLTTLLQNPRSASVTVKLCLHDTTSCTTGWTTDCTTSTIGCTTGCIV